MTLEHNTVCENISDIGQGQSQQIILKYFPFTTVGTVRYYNLALALASKMKFSRDVQHITINKIYYYSHTFSDFVKFRRSFRRWEQNITSSLQGHRANALKL